MRDMPTPTAYLTITRISGDPDQLLDGYRESATMMEGVGRDHGLIVHAAAPCPIPAKQGIIEWFGPIVHEYYAGTEGNGFVYCNSEEWLAHPGTVGKSILGLLQP